MLTVSICDDDFSVTKDLAVRVRVFLEKRGMESRILTYNNGDRLLVSLKERLMGGIYFLDILMPEISGLEIAREIRNFDETAEILFLTSSPEYALESYDVYASAYLMKPLKQEKLEEALLRLNALKQPIPAQRLLVKDRGVYKSIDCASVCALESCRNKMHIYLNNGEKLEIYSTMQEMESNLEGQTEFIRVHRSYMVNMQYVREILSDDIVLSSGAKIPLSKNYLSSFKAAYFHYMDKFF